MKANHENPFNFLSELELNAGEAEDLFSSTEIFCELRFSKEQLDLADVEVSVGASRATLTVETWGCDIVPGSRLNDLSRPMEQAKITSRQRRTAKGAISAGAQFSQKEASGRFGGVGSAELETEKNDERSVEWESLHVKSKAGKRWMVENATTVDLGAALDGTYIANERLCEIGARESANLVEFVGLVSVRKRDLVIEFDGSPVRRELRKFTHQEKVIKALMAKSLVQGSHDPDRAFGAGEIIVSRSTLSGEGDALE
jgi:hypothetical protein